MDDELSAMQAASAALEKLDDATRARVVRWLGERYGVVAARGPSPVSTGSTTQPDDSGEGFADFFHRSGASLDKEKALAAAYWLRSQGTVQFASAELNLLLKDLGYRVSNITDALSSSMSQKPALVIQVKKSGSARQARKLYKMTDAGAKWVESRLSGESV